MRPPRLIIVAAFFLTVVFLTFLSLKPSPSQTITTTGAPPKTGIRAFFSFRAPFTLFPPNAIITITNDNTTAFLARPAAFGPSLPVEGLRGQVWIGSGFGDDNIRQGAVAAGAEGELGCSDVPGWVDSYSMSGAGKSDGAKSGDVRSATTASKSKPHKRVKDKDAHFVDGTATSENLSKKKSSNAGPSIDDGTDDYLHHPLPGSTVSKPTDKEASESKGNHADIQSIQEGAEIAGKVVLLSRGGCGFLEKVKWAQRRGGIALIVGDDVKGGALLQMYARGDTSNVTIPSIFTSRTTAHLLSSLIGPGSFIEDTIDGNGKPSLKVQHNTKNKKTGRKHKSKPTFTPTATGPKPTMTPSKASTKKMTTQTKEKSTPITTQRPNWFMTLLFGSNGGDSKSGSSRPPSSGQLDWVLVDEWKDDDSISSKKITTKPNQKTEEDKKTEKKKTEAEVKPMNGDDFVIGVQDWRDPDLVGSHPTKDVRPDEKIPAPKADEKSEPNKVNNPGPVPSKVVKKPSGRALQETPQNNPSFRGGSITPGSGEYGAKNYIESEGNVHGDIKKDSATAVGKPKGFLSTIFGDDEEDIELVPPRTSGTGDVDIDDENLDEDDIDDEEDEDEGLWVTLTPTNGASPFLDTLLVLVVSPLVTLSIVYTLLLIRSRIRRRRWRAPKSVVERLPVRTYQTIVSPDNQSPRIPSPISSSPTTPLLQRSPSARPRPRSRTTTGVPESADLLRGTSSPLHVPTLAARVQEYEKKAVHQAEPSEWKKYMGKQIECVVCLEEYVDGVSRVMSLPCGHEFHVDCITPWLTTRRRTCPICKGDVVRSLARGFPSSPRPEPYHDDSDDDIQAQAAETVNNSSSAALPIAGSDSSGVENDLEQGIASPTPTRPGRSPGPGSWRNLLGGSLGSTSRRSRSPPEDRNR